MEEMQEGCWEQSLPRSRMQAMAGSLPPQWEKVSMSMANTR
jgi:hypothetical protein